MSLMLIAARSSHKVARKSVRNYSLSETGANNPAKFAVHAHSSPRLVLEYNALADEPHEHQLAKGFR